MDAKLIANNLQQVFIDLYQDAKFTIKNFGDIVICDSGSPSANFNIVFHYTVEQLALTQACRYIADQKHPFLLVQPEQLEITAAPEYLNTLYKNGLQKVGTATLVAVNFADAALANRKPMQVQQVNNPAMLQEWCDIADQSFGLANGCSAACFLPVRELLCRQDYQIKLYLGFDANLVAVATSMLYLPKDANKPAGHYFWGVKDGYRNQGVMSNMVQNMIHRAQEHGFANSVAQCFATSLGLAEKLGFKKYGAISLYANATDEK